MTFPKLPAKAAYLTINNARRRNALSLGVLRSLKDQLQQFNTSPVDKRLLMLPKFSPAILEDLEQVSASNSTDNEYSWLLHAETWVKHRQTLPNVLVLRTEGPVFSSGHDLGELRTLSHDEVKETFALCAEVMTMIRRCPAPVVCVIQGLATAAGAQLALTTDLPITTAAARFQLPGASIGLPCTSPSTAVARRLGHAVTYRMLALAEAIQASELPAGAVDIVTNEDHLEQRVAAVIEKLSQKTAGQPQALGKWAYWTQLGFHGTESGGDGYEDAVAWTGRVMALHARSNDAREGIGAFFDKRAPQWRT